MNDSRNNILFSENLFYSRVMNKELAIEKGRIEHKLAQNFHGESYSDTKRRVDIESYRIKKF